MPLDPKSVKMLNMYRELGYSPSDLASYDAIYLPNTLAGNLLYVSLTLRIFLKHLAMSIGRGKY